MKDSLIIAENERQFVAQELHDHVIQTLLQINMQVSICKHYLEAGQVDEISAEMIGLESMVNLASQQVRELITDLRAPLSEDGTFAGALQKQIDLHHERGGAYISLNGVPDVKLSGDKLLAVARMLQEILLNIRKHAWAREVKIDLETDQNNLLLTVSDDGVGFDASLVPNPLATKGGAGLINIDIRATAIGGQFDIISQPEQGTIVKVSIPL
jgi:two-component system nitrate/nitrite sensor histidine kinase NarX